MAGGQSVLGSGDWVHFDGGEHQVLGLLGASVRLRGDDGAEQVVLAGYLMAAAGFEVLGTEPLPAVEPFGLLDTLPDEVLADAKRGSATSCRSRPGCPRAAPPGTAPRAARYDPVTRTLADRQQAIVHWIDQDCWRPPSSPQQALLGRRPPGQPLT
jgi:putative transposase